VGSSKTGSRKENKTLTMAEVERLMNEELGRVTQEDWACYVRHAENLQGEDFAKETGRYGILEAIVISLKDI
jgi:hypothetical protein